MLREVGFKRLNLRALAARVSITAGSMYHHYGSKTELLGALAASGFRDLRRELADASGKAGEQVRLRAWARAYCRFAGREPALFALMFDSEIKALEPVVAARAAVIADLRAAVAEMSVAYDRGHDRIEEITLAIWAAAHGASAIGANIAGGSTLMNEVIAGFEALWGAPDLGEDLPGE